MIVDTTSSSNCGSATPVKFTIQRKREFTQVIEETMTFSKSMSEVFSSKVASSSKMDWKVNSNWNSNWNNKFTVSNENSIKNTVSSKAGYKSVEGAYSESGFSSETSSKFGTSNTLSGGGGLGGSRGRGGAFIQSMAKSWTNTVKSTETHSKKLRNVKKDSFSQGYSYLMPAGSRVTLTATVDTYRGDVKWWGTAYCYGSTGALLETQSIAGTYKGALIGDTRVVVDTILVLRITGIQTTMLFVILATGSKIRTMQRNTSKPRVKRLLSTPA